jgi:hypothetical protein
MKEAMNKRVCKMIWLVWMAAGMAVVGGTEMAAQTGGGGNDALYVLPEGVQTRWASPENWKGEKGVAAQKNAGRKGSACFPLATGESKGITFPRIKIDKALRRVFDSCRLLGRNLVLLFRCGTFDLNEVVGDAFFEKERPLEAQHSLL